MAVVKRDKSWAYTLEIGEPGGMRRQRWVGGFATKRAAVLAEAEARTSRAQGTYVETTREGSTGTSSASACRGSPSTASGPRT